MNIICFDRADVLSRPDEVRKILCLTPSSYMEARLGGLDASSTVDVFSDCDHARCVAAARQARQEMDVAVKHSSLPEAIKHMARQSVWTVAAVIQRLERTLPRGRMEVRDRTGRWRSVFGFEEAADVLFPRIIESGLGHRLRGRRPPAGGLYERLSQLATIRRRGTQVVVTSAKLKLGFDRMMEQTGLVLRRIDLTNGSWRDYPHLLTALLRRNGVIAVAPVAVTDEEFRSCCAELSRFAAALTHPGTRAAWVMYQPYLQANLAGMLALRRHAERLGRTGDTPVAAVSYEANGWASAAVLDGAHQAGGETVIINHNCHSRTGDAIADDVIETLFDQRKRAPFVTRAVHWTPSDAAYIGSRSRPGEPQGLSCRLNYPAVIARRAAEPFRIIHAGNYQNWSDFFPWVAETSDEFVRGIRLLSEAVAGLEGVELEFRIRPKFEADADVVRRSVVAADNIRVTSTDEDFLARLSNSELLITYFSTTVMQSLQMGLPVLLWGSTRRFTQVPARTVPPDATSRSAVYAVVDAADLRPMLAAIRDHHRGRPLSESELSAYRFDSDVGDAACVAATLRDSIIRGAE